MSAQLDIETASPTSPRSPTSLIDHAGNDENSEDTHRGLISGHLRTGLGFTKKALGLGITLLLVGAVVLLALNYSATTEISEGHVLSSSKDHQPLKTASLHYIVNRLDKYTESHDLKELFGTLEEVTVTSVDGSMDKVKATESHLSADGKKLTLTGATGSKAVIEKLTNGRVAVSIEDPTPPTAKTTNANKPGARRAKRKPTIGTKPKAMIQCLIDGVSKDLVKMAITSAHRASVSKDSVRTAANILLGAARPTPKFWEKCGARQVLAADVNKVKKALRSQSNASSDNSARVCFAALLTDLRAKVDLASKVQAANRNAKKVGQNHVRQMLRKTKNAGLNKLFAGKCLGTASGNLVPLLEIR